MQHPIPPIDLRSDTVTRPSQEMRAAIAAAPVGDDQYGEDPTVNLLQEKIAALLGKGAAGANAGVQFTEIGARGTFTVEEFLAARKPAGHIIYPPTTLVELENTQNRAGGVIFPQDEAERICGAARRHGVFSFLDGARLWNAAVASGRSPAELAAPFDLASVALSKGLGAPGGSLLAGSRELIGRAVRYRRMLGGAMRQVGIFAAAGLYALEHNITRLAEDHVNARCI